MYKILHNDTALGIFPTNAQALEFVYGILADLDDPGVELTIIKI